MMILYFLIGCSIVMALIFLAAFFWSLKDGQQDDMVTPGIRILFEDGIEDGKTGNLKDRRRKVIETERLED